ncbi:serine hydrolase domain-containing protein [Bacillus sp. OTU2372]|uniref:serine hydrolase domain-containing protein n=1 Tax=Bacillus sp. OTU2372 TaxID=3043858 RepID=UPI00313B54DE
MLSYQNLQPLLKSFVEKGPVGCSCAVMHEGEKVFEEYIGYADLETQKPITSETIFRIHSMTKIVTCAAALILYERGKFLLNDPLEEYLPEFNNPQVYRTSKEGKQEISLASRSILIKDLFTMTSGLSYSWGTTEQERRVKEVEEQLNNQEDFTKETYIRALSKALSTIPLAFDPGTAWKYGYSHDVLGALIEVISGKTLGQFLNEEIFKPLSMNNTYFNLPEEKKEHLSNFYIRNEEGKLIKTLDMFPKVDTRFESGGGGLFSTLGDYSQFAHMLASGGELNGNRIIGRNTIQLMSTNHLNSQNSSDFNWNRLAGYGYGLGVQVMIDPPTSGSNSPVGEFGWNGMSGTWVTICPKEKLSAVYMQQMLPNFEDYQQQRLRSVIYGSL